MDERQSQMTITDRYLPPTHIGSRTAALIENIEAIDIRQEEDGYFDADTVVAIKRKSIHKGLKVARDAGRNENEFRIRELEMEVEMLKSQVERLISTLELHQKTSSAESKMLKDALAQNHLMLTSLWKSFELKKAGKK